MSFTRISSFDSIFPASDTIIISECEETATKSADDNYHNTANGESRVINEIADTKESNTNVVVVREEQENNPDGDGQLAAVKDLIIELKDIYNEFLLQIKLVEKDLICPAKYDELESKVKKR